MGWTSTTTTILKKRALKDRALSFQKGCYLGQEVVCTLENRGKLSRLLVQLRFDGTHPPEALVGEALLNDTGSPVGRITSAVVNGNLGYGLGRVRAKWSEVGTSLTAGMVAITIHDVAGR